MIDYRETPVCLETLAALAWAVNQGDTDWLEGYFDSAADKPMTRHDHNVLDDLAEVLGAAAKAAMAQRGVLAKAA